MYSVEMRPMGGASAIAAELPALGTMRELSDVELLLVSGAWSWNDFGKATFSTALGGAAVGLYLGAWPGAGIGLLTGAIAGGIGYAGGQLWDAVLD